MDSSKDSTPHIVRKQFPEVELIYLKERTRQAIARNLGFEKASGDIIVFIDSDCSVESDWLSRIVTYFDDGIWSAVGGSVVNGNTHESMTAWAGYLAEFREFVPGGAKGEVEHLPTCNIAYRKEIFIKLGGFNPAYKQMEDLEFNKRLVQMGERILFDPQIKVYHRHRTRLKSFCTHQIEIGKYTAILMKEFPMKGSLIIKSRLLTILVIPLLIAVKFMNTFAAFWKFDRTIIYKYWPALFILSFGLIFWGSGFLAGAFTKLDTNKGENHLFINNHA